MSDDNDDINLRGLEKFIKAMTVEAPVAQVGILFSSSQRKGGGSNAEIGAKHEFGLDGMPQRSWLRVPLMDHLEEFLERSGAFDDEVLKGVIASGTLVPWTKKVGIVAEAVIAEGFDSGGFGKWKAWAPGYSSRTGNLLVDTGQLRRAVTSRVVVK